MNNATIPAMTRMFRDKDGATVKFSSDIRVYARILQEDIQITEVKYKGVWYTTETVNVKFDR